MQMSVKLRVLTADLQDAQGELLKAVIAMQDKKRGDAAWEYCVALFPVTVLTTVTKNREQEVM
jgi:hypothetical protein